LPGLGRGDWRVDLKLVTANPDQKPLQARVLANGALLAALPENLSDRRITLLLPAALVGSGDLDLTLVAQPFQTATDSRQLGIFVSDVTLQPAGSLPLLPPPLALLYTLAIVLG